MQKKEYTAIFGGKKVTAIISDLAEQANGSVMLSCENTVVLATAVMGKNGKDNPGFFNLTVEYLERYYATGKILGSRYQRREGRPTDEAILTSRVIDRTIRPLFDQRIKEPVQVIVTVLSVGEADPGILAINAVSLALGISDIPWRGPVGAVHVSKQVLSDGTHGQLTVDHYLRNSEEQKEHYAMDVTVCGRENKITMIEAMAFEQDEETMNETFALAMQEISAWESWQKEIIHEIGKEKIVKQFRETPDVIGSLFRETLHDLIWSDLMRGCSKQELYAHELTWSEIIDEKISDDEKDLAKDFYHHQVDRMIHDLALQHGKRADGRGLETVRSLYGEVGTISPTLHGTGIFYRGETHVLSVLTLAGPDAVQMEEGMEVQAEKRFMHHYNFPPYSAGETGRVGGLNRRETGHGMLVEKALRPLIPEKEKFPYTIRLVSESTASNGSTSQASICASSLALMDGGVPIARHVAGIAMGAMIDEEDSEKYVILTDIQGPEDHHGDMDFKVGGTEKGITAIQLDIKVDGVSLPLLADAMKQARTAREQILSFMNSVIDQPRTEMRETVPQILSFKIDVEMIGKVIGKGGETIQKIQKETGAVVTIEEDGTVYCSGSHGSAERARNLVQGVSKIWKEGDQGEGNVVKVLEGIGAIIALSETTDGMVHISEISAQRVEKVEDFLRVGMHVPFTVIKVDSQKNRIALSIKKDNPEFFK